MKNKGFTLVELAIVLTIGGLIIASTTTVLLNFLRQSKIDETTQRLQKIDTAVKQYMRVNNHLPCPASITAAPETTDFGVEISNCDTTGSSAASARLNGRGGLNVKIGAVPVRNLNIRDEDSMDGWQNRFFYVVTENLTTTSGFTQNGGAISIIDAFGNDVQLDPGTAQYAIISLGENGRGAYNINGQVAPSGGKACPSATTLEYTNCKFSGNATFRNATAISTKSGNTAFDDMMAYDTLPVPVPPSNNIPAGTVMAFEATKCPIDWAVVSETAGRVVVGTGTYTAEIGIPPYKLWDMAGFAKWNFAINELPSHRHYQQLTGWDTTPGPQPTLLLGVLTSDGGKTAKTGPAGGNGVGNAGTGRNQESENRQPYIALLYCQKL